MSTVPLVELGSILPGAVSFNEDNVNDTYRGQVLRADGTTVNAVLKDISAKELANELLSFILARLVSLPIPDAILAQVDAKDLPVSKGPITRDGRRLMFASVDVNVPSIQFRYKSDVPGRARLLGALTAWPPLGRLYGFDSWIANIDRHAGNLLFSSGADVWLIDQGWAFTDPAWTSAALDPIASYRHRLKEWLTPLLTDDGRTARVRQAGILEADLATIDIDAAIAASRIDILLSADDVEAMNVFLKARIREVTRLASEALDSPTLV